MRTLRLLPLSVSIALLAGCAQVCAPDQVAMGVARLTTLNADAAITLLNDDESCGFASQAVLDTVVRDGDFGSDGSLTWTVSDCEIDLGEGLDTEPSCDDGSYKTITGKITYATATKVVTGVLIDDPNTPIIPSVDTAVTLEIGETSFADFTAQPSDSDVSMTWVEGSISGKVFPRLAKNNTLGACSVQTSHKGFSDVVYGPSTVRLNSPDQEVEVAVGGSDLKGQVGQNKGKAEDGFVENDLQGSITIWDTEYSIPIEGDDGGLDPDYDEAAFYEQDQCKDDILVPISFDC